jgi:hypothetical protein
MCLIILLASATAGEGDVLLANIAQELFIEKGAAIVRADSQEGKGKASADGFKPEEYSLLTAVGAGLAFRPTSGDVGQIQSEEELSVGRTAAMGDQVDFGETGALVIPIHEGADGDLVLKQAAGFGGG